MKCTVCLVFLALTCGMSQTHDNHKKTGASIEELESKLSKPHLKRKSSSLPGALLLDDEIKEYFQMPDKSGPKISTLVTRVKQRNRRPRVVWRGNPRNSAIAKPKTNGITHRGPTKTCNNTNADKSRPDGRPQHIKKHSNKYIRTPADQGQASKDRMRARLDQRGLKGSSKNDSKITVSIGAVKSPRNRRRWVRLGQYRPVVVYPQNVRFYPRRWPAHYQNNLYNQNSQANGNPRSVSATAEALAVLTQKLSKMEANMARLRETVLRQGAAHIRSSERVEAMLTVQAQQVAKNGEGTQEVLKSIKRFCACSAQAEAESVHGAHEDTTPSNQPLHQHSYKSGPAALLANLRQGSRGGSRLSSLSSVLLGRRHIPRRDNNGLPPVLMRLSQRFLNFNRNSSDDDGLRRKDDVYSDKNDLGRRDPVTDAVTSSGDDHTPPLPKSSSDLHIPTRNDPSHRYPTNRHEFASEKSENDTASHKNDTEYQHASDHVDTGIGKASENGNGSAGHDQSNDNNGKHSHLYADSGQHGSPEQFTDIRENGETPAQLTDKRGFDELSKQLTDSRDMDEDRHYTIKTGSEDINSTTQTVHNPGTTVSSPSAQHIETTSGHGYLNLRPTERIFKQDTIYVMPSNAYKDTRMFASDDPDIHVLSPSQESHAHNIKESAHGDKNIGIVNSSETEAEQEASPTQANHNQNNKRSNQTAPTKSTFTTTKRYTNQDFEKSAHDDIHQVIASSTHSDLRRESSELQSHKVYPSVEPATNVSPSSHSEFTSTTSKPLISSPVVNRNAEMSTSENELATDNPDVKPIARMPAGMTIGSYAAAETLDIDQLLQRTAEIIPYGQPESQQSGTTEHTKASSTDDMEENVFMKEAGNNKDLNEKEIPMEADAIQVTQSKEAFNSSTSEPVNVSDEDLETEDATGVTMVIVGDEETSVPTTQQSRAHSDHTTIKSTEITTAQTVMTDKHDLTSKEFQQTTPPLIFRTLSSLNTKRSHGAQSFTNPEFKQQSHDNAMGGLNDKNNFVFPVPVGNHKQVTEKQTLGEKQDESLSKHRIRLQPSEESEDAVTTHILATTLSTAPQNMKTQRTGDKSTPTATLPTVPDRTTNLIKAEYTDLDVDFNTGDIQNDGMPGVTWIVRPSRPPQRSRWPIRLTRSAARRTPQSHAWDCSMQGVLKFTFTPPAKPRRYRHHRRHRYRHYHRRGEDEEEETEEEESRGGRRKLLLNMEFQSPKRWVFNLGDSIANNGFSGDGAVQENDCEAQGYGTTFAVYGSDKHPNGRQKLLRLDNSFIVHNVTLVVSDQTLHWNNHHGNEGELKNSSLFALSGQSDRQGSVNYDVYLGLNRVIDGSYRSGRGLCRLSARWLE